MHHIPKIIHYVWVGGSPIPPQLQSYMETWKIHCPDYELRRWDESVFDIRSNAYVREAYALKKWAFVSDYIRLYALWRDGGIYMDTDVEVIRNLDGFLHHRFFSGFENEIYFPTGIIGAEPACPVIGEWLDTYKRRHFKRRFGRGPDLTSNVQSFTALINKKYGSSFIDTGIPQEFEKGCVLYPQEVFCCKKFRQDQYTVTPRTYTVHHFTESWVPVPLARRLRTLLKQKIGEDRYYRLKDSLGLSRHKKK